MWAEWNFTRVFLNFLGSVFYGIKKAVFLLCNDHKTKYIGKSPTNKSEK